MQWSATHIKQHVMLSATQHDSLQAASQSCAESSIYTTADSNLVIISAACIMVHRSTNSSVVSIRNFLCKGTVTLLLSFLWAGVQPTNFMTTKNANRIWLTSGELAVSMALKWFHTSQPMSNTFTESKEKQHLYGNLLHSAQHEFHFFHACYFLTSA